jgi:DNA recombination protein RmuC
MNFGAFGWGVIGLAIFLAAVLGALMVWLRTQVRLMMPEILQKPLLDLTERVARAGSDTREAMAEKLARHFLESQERLERTLGQNRLEIQGGLTKTTAALETKFQSLEVQVNQRLEIIGKNVETKLSENMKEGFKHFEKVQEHLQAAELKLQSLNVVGQSIADLNNLLKLPHLRGGFGEGMLERLLADFLPAGSFELQYAVVPGSTERVDAIVRMARQVLPIDSKFPREQILPLFESQDPGALAAARKTLSEWIRGQAKSIARKYIRPDHGTTDIALLFLPSETVYLEVCRDTALFDELSKCKVYPVSPNTLAIGLRSVMMAQEYYDMSRGVEKTIEDVKKARKHFDNFERKFDEIGASLERAQNAYSTAHSHLGKYGSSVVRLTGDEDSDPGIEKPVLPGPAAQLPLVE